MKTHCLPLRARCSAALHRLPLLVAVGLALLARAQTITGQNQSSKAITTAVSFLTIAPDARAAGMGDVGAATSPDGNSAYWNAAKLAFVNQKSGISFSFTPWMTRIVNDMFVAYLSGYYKIKEVQAVGVSMKYFNIGEVFLNTGPDVSQQIGRFNPREFAIDFTYSRILTPHVSIGGSLRYIHSNLTGSITSSGFAAKPGYSVAADVGVFYKKPSPSKKSQVSFGAVISNIGSKITYTNQSNADFIPTNLRIGAAYTRHFTPEHSLSIAADINKLLTPSPGPNSKGKNLLQGIFGSFGDAVGGFGEELKEITLSTGLEYVYKDFLSGRVGCFLEAEEKGNRQYVTVGLGAKVRRFGLDASYLVPISRRNFALSDTFRISLSVHFDKSNKATSAQ